MLHEFRTRGFKSLRDVHVEFARLNVVFGPNATGKSNLLEAIVLMSRLVRERTLPEAFEDGIRGYASESFSYGRGGIEEFLSSSEATLRLEASLGDAHAKNLSYAIEVGIRPMTGELFLKDEELQPLHAKGGSRGKPVIGLSEDGMMLRVRRRGKPAHPSQEPPGLHHTLSSNLQFAGDGYESFDLLREEMSSWQSAYLDPRISMRRSEPPQEKLHIGDTGQWLVPFLHRLQEDPETKRAFRSIMRAVCTVIPSIEGLKTTLDRSRGLLDLSILQDGVWMPARIVSEGTLRVLALCAMAANPFNRGLVAFEEPENGVHPRRIREVTALLASAAKTRQIIVTTHSPLVVGEIVRLVREGVLPNEDVRLIASSSGVGGTRFRQFNPSGPLFEDSEVDAALDVHDHSGRVQAMLERGWLDG